MVLLVVVVVVVLVQSSAQGMPSTYFTTSIQGHHDVIN
jgi:hypothetical protein